MVKNDEYVKLKPCLPKLSGPLIDNNTLLHIEILNDKVSSNYCLPTCPDFSRCYGKGSVIDSPKGYPKASYYVVEDG